jgi:hypothetical protein
MLTNRNKCRGRLVPAQVTAVENGEGKALALKTSLQQLILLVPLRVLTHRRMQFPVVNCEFD